MKPVIGIIGCGNMGGAIASRAAQQYEVAVYDKDAGRAAGVAGVRKAASLDELLAVASVVVLAVKPQDFDEVLARCKNLAPGALVISIAAGITTGRIEAALGKVRVVRAMPNLGAIVGESTTALCGGQYALDSDLEFAGTFFSCVGRTLVMAEGMINAATAISGSGPAYVLYEMEKRTLDPAQVTEEERADFIARLTEAARAVGFDARIAAQLAASTTSSALALAAQTGQTAGMLRQRITSKGGTTEAALAVIARSGSWVDGAKAALQRAEELARKG